MLVPLELEFTIRRCVVRSISAVGFAFFFGGGRAILTVPDSHVRVPHASKRYRADQVLKRNKRIPDQPPNHG